MITLRLHACAFCVALQRLAVRRRDAVLAAAAIRLRAEHTDNDAEREAFARPGAQRTRLGNGLSETRSSVGSKVPIRPITSKTERCDGRRDA